MTATTAEELAREWLCTSHYARAYAGTTDFDEEVDSLTTLLTTFSERVRGEAIEECARVADKRLNGERGGYPMGANDAALGIAKDIRALSPTTETTRTPDTSGFRTPGTVEVCMSCKMPGPWARCQDILQLTPPHLCPMQSLPPFPDNGSHGNDAIEHIARLIAKGTSSDPGCELKSPMEIANEIARFAFGYRAHARDDTDR